MQLTLEMPMLQKTKPRIELIRFRAAAAGISSRASTRTAPTIFKHATVSNVIIRTKTYSNQLHTDTSTAAKLGLRLASRMRLNRSNPVASITIVTTSRTFMSLSLTVRTEPKRTASRMCVLTLRGDEQQKRGANRQRYRKEHTDECVR